MLLRTINISALATFMFLFISCAKTGSDEEKSELLHELNNKNYEVIILKLERQNPEKLQRDGTLKYLMDAYLGHCGFDSINIYKKVQRIQSLDTETDNPQEILNKFKNAIGVIYSNKTECDQYISRANNLSIFLDPNEQNIDDFNLYRGNLNLIETLYLIKNSVNNVSGVNFRNTYQDIENIKNNIQNMKYYYGKSFDFLDDVADALENVHR